MNLLKPKKTTFNEKAAVYRKIIEINKSKSLAITYYFQAIGKDWNLYFDKEKNDFVEFNIIQGIPNLNLDITNRETIFIDSTNADTTYFVNYVIEPNTNYVTTYYFHFNRIGKGSWTKSTVLEGTYTLQNAGFADIGKYQMNKYVYVGSIDYCVKGEVQGTTTQPIKGNIMPLTSLNITHFNDEINLTEKDLIVINGALYSVENPNYSQKQMPKPYKIYYATLNSIL